jgi:uncharacterized protein (TIGR03437 family)
MAQLGVSSISASVASALAPLQRMHCWLYCGRSRLGLSHFCADGNAKAVRRVTADRQLPADRPRSVHEVHYCACEGDQNGSHQGKDETSFYGPRRRHLSRSCSMKPASTRGSCRLAAMSHFRGVWAALPLPLLLAGLCAAQTGVVFNNIAGVCSNCLVLPIFGNSLAAQFSPAAATLATDARVLVIAGYSGVTSPLFKVAIFSDVSGLPGLPVSQVVTNLTAPPRAGGIVTAPFGQPVLLEAETPYWLVLMPMPGTDVDWYMGGPSMLPCAVTTSTTGSGGWQRGATSIGIAQGPEASLQFAVDGTVLPPPLAVTTSSPLPNGTVGVAYSQALAATGGTPPYSGWTVSSGALPPGLGLNGSSGVISGTPATASGQPFSFGVIVKDSTGATSPVHPLSIAINPAGAQTVSLRSGNGTVGGTDSAITFLLGPEAGGFPSPFTQSDFLNAQSGPAAFIVPPNSAWISGLSEDPSAKWIGTNPTTGDWGNTALYAISFQVSDAFSSASLTLRYAADDVLGCGGNCSPYNGTLYMNGTAFCGSMIPSGNNFSQEQTINCDGIGPVLHQGTNWLYIDNGNAEPGPAGLLFSATITTSQAPSVPSINSGGVVSAASYAAPVVPGSLAAAYGNFLLSSPSGAPAVPLPTNLSGLSMQFAGEVQAPLIYASDGQVNLQVPWELAGQTQSQLTASIGGQTSAAQAVNIAPFSPGIFSMNAQGSGQGAILDTSYRLVDPLNPAVAGSTYIQIYCTGLGPVAHQPPSGFPAPANPLAETPATPTVTIGNVPAQVVFSGLAPGFVGLYQVNAQVPPGAPSGTAVPVVISMGNAVSNAVTIAVGN